MSVNTLLWMIFWSLITLYVILGASILSDRVMFAFMSVVTYFREIF